MDLNDIERFLRWKKRLERDWKPWRPENTDMKEIKRIAQAIEELMDSGGVYYIAQERAFAPGIVKSWPDVIAHPYDPNGRLVKRCLAPELPPENDSEPPKRAA